LGFQPNPGEAEEMVAEFFDIDLEATEEIILSQDDFLKFIVLKLTNRDMTESLKQSFNCFDTDEKSTLLDCQYF
jgi:Ca2+-binding EF-hand superfamily protein